MRWFYMIRKIGTNRYYCGDGNWYGQSVGIMWWDEPAYTIYARLRALYPCELVKFKCEEVS